MAEHASQSYCLIEPKKEILIDQDSEVCIDYKDFVIPKKEYTRPPSDTPEDKQSFKILKPIKTETILCKEIGRLQKYGVGSLPDPNMSTGFLEVDTKLESGHGSSMVAYAQPYVKAAERKRGKVLHSDAREITYNVIKYFDEEKFMERYHPYQLSGARAAMATGLSAGTISKIKKEGALAALTGSRIASPKKGKRGRNNTRVPIDNFDLSAIRQIISSIYGVQKEVPTLKEIIAAAKSEINYKGSKTTLRRILKEKLGFTFKKCRRNRMVLIEKENIKASRVRYLRRIRQNDSEKRPVIYLDKSWINAKCGDCRKNANPGQRWVIVHACSENGFIDGAGLLFKAKFKTGDFQDEMDGQSFIKYLKDKLIPNLPLSSIVIIENAAYRSMQIDKAPTNATKKDDIIQWMEKNQYQFDKTWTKAEMLTEMRNKRIEKKYVADKLLAQHGHEVLRLPPCNCGLNPIEYICKLIKQRVDLKYFEQPESNIEVLIKEAIDSVTPDDFKEQMNHVKVMEKRYWVQDVTKEDEFEKFITDLGLTSEDSEQSSDDHDDIEDV